MFPAMVRGAGRLRSNVIKDTVAGIRCAGYGDAPKKTG